MPRHGGWPSSGFGPALKRLRLLAGLSQARLADLAGCSVFTVAKLERGEQEPAWPLVLSLSRALDVECGVFTHSGDEVVAQKESAPVPAEDGSLKPSAVAVSAPKNRGRPRKAPAPPAAPKKRGRPRKERET